MSNKKKQGIPPTKFVILVGFIMYSCFKFIYGTEAIGALPPFVQLAIDVGWYMFGIFIGKPIVRDLKDYISQQISILTNKKLDKDQKVYEQQSLLKWICLDLNDMYEDDKRRFYEYLNEQGYTEYKINVHPEGKPTETPAPKTPA